MEPFQPVQMNTYHNNQEPIHHIHCFTSISCHQSNTMTIYRFDKFYSSFTCKKLVTNSMNMFLKVLLAIFLLFCFMFKKEHFWNKGKCFLFHFESFFSSWDNKILNFQAFIWHDIIKCLSMKYKTYFTG